MGEHLTGPAISAPFLQCLDKAALVAQDQHDLVQEGLTATEVTRFLSTFEKIPRRQLLEALKLNARVLVLQKTLKLSIHTQDSPDDLAYLLRLAIEVLGSPPEAKYWLTRASAAFSGRRPIDLFFTRQGTRVAINNLVRLKYGVYG